MGSDEIAMDAVDQYRHRWQCQQLCQGQAVVTAIADEQLALTVDIDLDLIARISGQFGLTAVATALDVVQHGQQKLSRK